MRPSPHRKRIKHFHEPGDVHELTFSCYRRMPLLTNDKWQALLARFLDQAVQEMQFRLVAFVFMPEHVHLLVYPQTAVPQLDGLLAKIKQPFSSAIRKLLEESQAPLLQRLTLQERPGKQVFRYWQEGPGYDRNLQTPQAILSAIDYLHRNPVRRKLCERAVDWKWSSARHYLGNHGHRDPDLPEIHGLPPECFDAVCVEP